MPLSIIALGYACSWGVGLTLAKIALGQIAPTTLLLIQLLSSVLFLLGLDLIRRRQTLRLNWRKGFKDWFQDSPLAWPILRQGKAGLFEPALSYLCGTIGLELTSATNAALLGATEVVLTILLAALVLGERLTLTKLGLAGLSFTGIVLLIGQQSGAAAERSLLGDGLILLGVLFAVVYVLLSKRQIGDRSQADSALAPLALTTAQQIVGLAAVVLGSALLALINPTFEVDATQITLPFWLLAIGSGVLQYALAFLLYLTALQRVQVSQAAFYVALIPVFGVVSAILLIGERLNGMQAIGAMLIVGSSYLASRLTDRRSAEAS